MRGAVVESLAVPSRLRNAAIPQFIFLYFTILGTRQFGHEFEISWDRELGQPRFTKRTQFGLRELLARRKDDSRHDFVFGKRRTDGKCCGVGDCRMTEQDLLD